MAPTLAVEDFARLEPGLARSMLPVWVLRADSMRIEWANDPALELWNATSRDELFAREVIAGAPPAVLARIEQVLAQVRAGETVLGEWIIYPNGIKTTVLEKIEPVRLSDDALGVLFQAQPLAVVDEGLERNIAMFRHSVVISALVDTQGHLLAQNPSAAEAFGAATTSWLRWFADPDEAQRLLAATLGGDGQHALLRVAPPAGGERWHMVETQTIRDPVSEDFGLFVEHFDVTARVEAEGLAENRGRQLEALTAALELVDRQREQILALSAPLLEVGRGTLAAPIIGRFDDLRANLLTTRLLERASSQRIQRVLIDLTGLAHVDEEIAARLELLVRSLELVGAQVVVSGVQPGLAQSLATMGHTLGGVTFTRSVAAGLQRFEAS